VTLIWLIVWALSGMNDPVIIENLSTQPDLNSWATWLIIAVAWDLSITSNAR
jgi:hypothetical protein